MDLVARWAELLRAEATLPEHETEVIEAALVSDTLTALAAGGAEREAILIAFRESEGTDEALRHALGTVLFPPFPRAVLHPDEYRSHPEVAFDADRMPVGVALGLPVAEDLVETGSDPLDFARSWFCGRPAVPGDVSGWEWPTRSDGAPLTHVVQVDLASEVLNQGEDHFALTGLPGDGVIQLFHDLETFGWDTTDDTTAWHVAWHPIPAGEEVDLEVAEGGPLDAVPAFPINPQLLATVPSPLDLTDASDEEWTRFERARQWLEQSAYEMNLMADDHRGRLTPWDDDYEPLPPISRMGGFGHAETNKELLDVLDQQLPLTGDDDHVLLFDVNPLAITETDALINWFHGRRHLEVWMRRSDLDSRRFDHVWCVIRTDN
ncbi:MULTISPECIES: DUF1963 domain-containing protein [Nocardioides]|uniref:DUF1963 domain-containing protein n=1 Tax=Nocardioides vastitatis TaxID=2568655 RepID=A0ABW0ZJ00_9ACTN|nr:DUF1963 domain-containing protein [Nocardioides sp.]